MTTWSLTTAKLKSSFTFSEELDLKGYVLYPFSEQKTVFHRDWYQESVLLWRKLPDKTSIDMKSFLGDRFRVGMNGGKSALEGENMQFMQMKVIEITGSENIITHFQFVHPIFSDHDYQRIYFSDDRKLMMEKFVNHEVFLYSREDLTIFEKTKEVKWNLIRRFINH